MGIGLENLSAIKGKYSDKGREISLFSYLYVMNLLSLLTELITENENKRKFLGRFVFGLDDIKLFSSGHQTSDRMGDMDFDEIRDFYFDTLDNNKMKEREIRFGAPDSILTPLIISKFKKIYNSFINNPSTQKIRFVHINEDNEYEEKFDYIEFVLSKSRDMKTFTVVTSAYSDNGDFLKKMVIQLNLITLGQRVTDNINRQITFIQQGFRLVDCNIAKRA
jgi:hypothetical protein